MSASRPLPRRTLLASGAGLGALALTGCTIDLPWTDTSVTTPSLSKPDVDVPAAAHARALLRQMGLRIDGSALADQPVWRALSQLHGRHAGALAEAAPSSPTPTDPPSSVPATRAQLLAEEAALQRRLAALAQKAHSGAFARLLGSMAAATSQLLEVAR